MTKKSFYIIVSIICIIISLNIFVRESIILNVTPNNNTIIKSLINDPVIDNINDITKFELGEGWHAGQLSIYYSNGTMKDIHLYGTNLYELEKYSYENGYSLDELGKIFFIISIISFIIFFILKVRTK